MAVQRRNNILSQERIDCPAFRSIESAASADFDTLIQAFVTGAGNPYVVNGFTINFSSNPIGGAASNLQVVVALGALFATTASQSGTFYLVPAGTPNVVLNAATTSNVFGSFVPSSFNYVGVDYYRFQDPGTDQQFALWDPTAQDEDQIITPAAIVLNYEFVVTSSIWAANILPLAIIETDSSNNVVSITDARPLLFRLGTGGASPNPLYTYPFPEGTTENPVTSTSNSSNPFYGGDKGITDLKDWMNAVMSQIRNIQGSTYWYSQIAPASIATLLQDLGNTVITGSGEISNGILPNSDPIFVTTGNITSGSFQLSNLPSVAGLSVGDYVFATGVPSSTTIVSILPEYQFTTSSANASVGSVYSNNGQTFTVINNITAGTTLLTAGTGAPLVVGSSSLLNSASAYAILGASAVTGSTGSGSTLTGDLGIYPNNATSITNFPPSTFTGTENAGNSAAHTAQNDALSCYTTLQAMTPTTVPTELGGQTLAAGVYSATSGTFTLNGTLTLTGTSSSVYVFQTASTLITGGVSTPVIALGSVLPQNIYWVVGSSATLNSSHSGTFQGNVVAQASVTDTLGGTVNGSLIALTGAVTLSNTSAINAIPGGASGTLTKISGTGDATITFSAFTAPAFYSITLSNPASLPGSGINVSFYSPSAITAPGQINWNDPIYIRVIGSSLTYELAANPTSTDISLASDDVAYITLVRDVPVAPNLIFTGGSAVVTSVGSVAWTSLLLPGDYVKVATDTVSGYYQILTVDSSSQVTLTSNVSVGDNYPGGISAKYAFGSYYASPTPSGNPRAIQVSTRETVPVSGNTFWLFIREDNGGAPRVYIRFLSEELDNGESVEVAGTTSQQILQYIGSMGASDSMPQYVSALNPGSVPQISNFVIGAGSTITGGQYFLINSSANARQYAVWFTVNGVGSQPSVPYVNNYVEVAILSTDTASEVATKIQNALDTLQFGDFVTATGSEYIFTTSSANATLGSTYTNNSQTFTVVSTISSGTTLITTGTGAPALSGPSSLLNSASNFALLAYSAITNTGASVITGDVGITPGSSITPGGWTLIGTEYVDDATAVTAQNDATSCYNTLSVHSSTTIPSALDGQTLTAGYYSFSSGAATLAQSGPGTLTFSGSASDVFVIITASTLTTGAGGVPTMVLSGGALAQNIYWVVGSSATINSGTAGTFQGNIIAQASVTDTLGGTVNGSMIALTGAVTISAAANANAIPGATGLLTKASGTGDATITFSAFSQVTSLLVTNASAGSAIASSNGNVGAPFAVYTVQSGTGVGNYFITDGENLTLSIKKLDEALGNLEASLDSPTYDEVIEIVASGATPPTSLNGPVANGTIITLPLNSREGNILAQYTVGRGTLEVFLNGQFLDVESNAYAEVGATGSPSNQIQILTLPGGGLVVGDELELRFGSGGGGGGAPGPAGPPGANGAAGAQGPAGFNAAGGPVAISTKTSDYSILTTDCFLMADCTSGNITFTLPTASGNTGRIFYATKIDSSANALTVAGNGSDLINEASMFIMAFQDQEIGIISTGSGWRVM